MRSIHTRACYTRTCIHTGIADVSVHSTLRYMHNDYMPIRDVQWRLYIMCITVHSLYPMYICNTGSMCAGAWNGVPTITSIDEQMTKGIGSARVIDPADLPSPLHPRC